ncbi:AAA family ATPase [Allostreptomyces psammosilenae]|uniref:Energy-coupling factor transporter ATP-binding protein EcfA2 n=1 Tax=Allostreptomyces psammosilenae TaxID=1892865 RepID=A0A852ZWZ9_9ACTN|nr:AAA family ATPase [Allostreptomyces psammosilenae]NYI06923.1 energy-coupling factor transporter ATP-binding protein EcfA2 [Allostreptomyces psammosilenae]
MDEVPRHEVLLIAGRSGVGKSTVGWEVSALLRAASVAHCLLEGDLLDQIHPAPADDPHRSKITEDNLTAVWRNFAARGHHRLVYTNTVSVLEPDMFVRALGGAPRIVGVLLTAGDDTARRRLEAREIGSQLDAHLVRSARMARHLDAVAPPWVARIATDGRSVPEIARDVVAATGWCPGPE